MAIITKIYEAHSQSRKPIFPALWIKDDRTLFLSGTLSSVASPIVSAATSSFISSLFDSVVTFFSVSDLLFGSLVIHSRKVKSGFDLSHFKKLLVNCESDARKLLNCPIAFSHPPSGSLKNPRHRPPAIPPSPPTIALPARVSNPDLENPKTSVKIKTRIRIQIRSQL